MASLSLSPAQAAQELLRRRDASSHLLSFTEYTCPRFQPAEHHSIICDALDRVERGECKRLIIEAPPRHSKSELASRRFPAYYLGRHPDQQLICATYAQEFANDFGREVRQIVASTEFKALFPDVTLAPDSAAVNRWHTNHGGVYIAAGTGGPITGRGAHLALWDDPIKNRQDADSEAVRKMTWDWYTSVFRLRLMPDAAIVLIMTRWNEDDPAGRLIEQMDKDGEQWEIVRLPACTNSAGEPVPPTDPDAKALWPEWYDIPALIDIHKTIAPRDWLALFQQTPTADEGTFFKREWFNAYDTAPDHLNVYMSGDFAVTDGGGDYTELGVWGVSPDKKVYLLDWWYGQTTADVWITEMVERFRFWKPQWFIGEAGPIRRAIEPILRKRMFDEQAFCAIEWLPHGQANKEAAARPFQAIASQGLVHFPQNDMAERVKDQLLRFPAGRYDDAVDTCSLFGRWIDMTWSKEVPKPKQPQVKLEKVTLYVDDFFKQAKQAW